MEEILIKNIFNDKELEKLSPDFTPYNTLLRLQTRSTMVKDTHSHKLKTEILQRKTVKRPKECYKINKEIMNIRNSFQNVNLRNQIMLKNAVKYVETMQAEDFANNIEEEDDILKNETKIYLQEISEKNHSLIVQNQSDFKLNDKPKIFRPSTENTNRKFMRSKEINQEIERNKGAEDNFEIEEFLRIECTLHKPEIFNGEISLSDNEAEADAKESESTLIPSTAPKEIDKDLKDLQNLLVMMTISPKINDVKVHPTNGKVFEDKNENKPITEDFNNSVPLSHTDVETNDVVVNKVLNISPIRIKIRDKQKMLLVKYVEKWKNIVAKKKERLAQEREDTLNSFFYKLEKKKIHVTESPGPETGNTNKAKILAKDYSKYRHRYQMQKHIIALQKAKLEEQSRIIEELKYNRIVEASKISIDAMKDEIRKTYNDIDRQLKPKLKCLTNELKLNDIEEPSLVLHCLKVPQFLQRMEKRAREREEKHAMIRERRKQMEEERIKMKQQEELAKGQMDKEEKLKRMKELKDKRKREKIDGIRKKQHAERIRALTVMADLHYEKNLMAKYGMRPFKLLIELKRNNIQKSKAHYKFQLKKNVFLKWMFYTEDKLYERSFKAEDFYKKKLMGRVFDAMKKNHHNYVVKKQVAEDYYDLFVMNLVFRKFREALKIIKAENENKWQKAVVYHNCDLLFKTFTCWRSLPALNSLMREQEARKARWREKVLQVVPDYTPPDD